MNFILDTNELLRLGLFCHIKAKYAEADAIYSRVLTLEPNHTVANYNLAQVAIFHERYTEALKLLITASKSDPYNDTIWKTKVFCSLKLADVQSLTALISEGESKGFYFSSIENEVSLFITSLNAQNNNSLNVLITEFQSWKRRTNKKSIQTIIRLAKRFFKNGELLEAKSLLRNTLQYFPGNYRVLSLLASVEQAEHSYRSDSNLSDEDYNHLLQLFRNNQLEMCEAKTLGLLDSFTSSKRLLNLIGLIRREQKRYDDAIEYFERAMEIDMTYVDTYINLGCTLLDFKKFNRATEILSKALKYDKDNSNVLNNLGLAYFSMGKNTEAKAAFEKAIQISPRFAEAHINYGYVLKEIKDFQTALKHLSTALKLKPNMYDVYLVLGEVYSALGQNDKAIKFTKKILEFDVNNYAALNNLGTLYKKESKYDLAKSYLFKALKLNSSSVSTLLNLGNIMQESGDFPAAIAWYKKALDLDPTFTAAHYNLSRLITYNYDDPQISQIKTLLQSSDMNSYSRSELLFVLAKYEYDVKNYESTFNYISEGNLLIKETLNYSVKNEIPVFDRAKAFCYKIRNPILTLSDSETQVTPIFIVGMPRSGTTLVEQIVSSHRDVSGAGELEYMPDLCRELSTDNVPENQIRTVREQYLTRLRNHADRKQFVTDKLPLNFLNLPIICAAFPEAKIIHVKRDPRAVCWSNFEHRFTSAGLSFSLDLSDVVTFYNMYSDIMDLWNKEYNERITQIDYEELVVDPENVIPEFISLLSLPWDPNCLSPDKNLRSVKTASQRQIREGIYKRSSDKWKLFEPYIGDVFSNLREL